MKVFKGIGGAERSLTVRKVGKVFQVVACYPEGEDIAPDCWRYADLESAIVKARAVEASWVAGGDYRLFADTKAAISSAEVQKMTIHQLAHALVRADDFQRASDLTAELQRRARRRA